MNKIEKWLNENLIVITNKISKNIWVQSIQNAIIISLPMIFVGSLILVLNLFRNIFKGMPDLTPINTFSFGIFSIFITFLISYQVMEKKKQGKKKIIAGFTSISLFLMLIGFQFTDNGVIFDFYRLGASGMLIAMFSSILVSLVMLGFSKISLFSEDSLLPDIVKNWFDSMIPISTSLFIGYLLVYVFNFDFFKTVVTLFNPITSFAQTLPGFLLICFVPVFLYSFGISGWILTPVTFPIALGAIAVNSEAVALGLQAQNITTFEVIYCGWVFIGGQGATLPLNILMLFAKSKKLKSLSKATIIPSIFNINEPLVFGTPIAWNLILMIPMWINTIIIPTLVYVVLKKGLVAIPNQLFTLYSMPQPISTYLVSPGINSLVLYAVVVLLVFLIWYPFFKIYDNQCLKNEVED